MRPSVPILALDRETSAERHNFNDGLYPFVIT